MSKTDAILLALTADRWRAARARGQDVELREISIESGAEPSGAADAIREVLAGWGYAGQGVCLGLPAAMVFGGRVECDRLPRSQRRTALLYRLEEQLPLAAEQLTADFLPAVGGRSLGLAVQTDTIRELLDRLAETGIEVAAICPTALLAARAADPAGKQPCDYAIIADEDDIDVIRMAETAATGWFTTPATTTDLTRGIQADMLAAPTAAEPATARLIAPTDWAPAEALGNGLAVDITDHHDEPAVAIAAKGAAAVLAGRDAGMVNFRRDALGGANAWGRHGRLIRSAAAMGMVLLIALAGLFYWRSLQYEGLTRTAEARQVAAFHRVAPNTLAPPDVAATLDARLAKLTGVRGADARVPARPCALRSWRQIMAHLPATVRLRILNLQVTESTLLIEGQTRSHADAEAIKKALAAGGLTMNRPRSEGLATGGVSFTITGKPLGYNPKKPGGRTKP